MIYNIIHSLQFFKRLTALCFFSGTFGSRLHARLQMHGQPHRRGLSAGRVGSAAQAVHCQLPRPTAEDREGRQGETCGRHHISAEASDSYLLETLLGSSGTPLAPAYSGRGLTA